MVIYDDVTFSYELLSTEESVQREGIRSGVPCHAGENGVPLGLYCNAEGTASDTPPQISINLTIEPQPEPTKIYKKAPLSYRGAKLQVFSHKCLRLNKLPKEEVLRLREKANPSTYDRVEQIVPSTKKLGVYLLSKDMDDFTQPNLVHFDHPNFEYHPGTSENAALSNTSHSFVSIGNAATSSFCHTKKGTKGTDTEIKLYMEEIPSGPQMCGYAGEADESFDTIFRGERLKEFEWNPCLLSKDERTPPNPNVGKSFHQFAFIRLDGHSVSGNSVTSNKNEDALELPLHNEDGVNGRIRSKPLNRCQHGLVKENCTLLPLFKECNSHSKIKDECSFLNFGLDLTIEAEDEEEMHFRKQFLNLVDQIFRRICKFIPRKLPSAISRILMFYLKNKEPTMKKREDTWKNLISQLQNCKTHARPMIFHCDNVNQTIADKSRSNTESNEGTTYETNPGVMGEVSRGVNSEGAFDDVGTDYVMVRKRTPLSEEFFEDQPKPTHPPPQPHSKPPPPAPSPPPSLPPSKPPPPAPSPPPTPPSPPPTPPSPPTPSSPPPSPPPTPPSPPPTPPSPPPTPSSPPPSPPPTPPSPPPTPPSPPPSPPSPPPTPSSPPPSPPPTPPSPPPSPPSLTPPSPTLSYPPPPTPASPPPEPPSNPLTPVPPPNPIERTGDIEKLKDPPKTSARSFSTLPRPVKESIDGCEKGSADDADSTCFADEIAANVQVVCGVGSQSVKTPLFYYEEAAELEFNFNSAVDFHWKVFSSVAGYCTSFYKSRKSEIFPRMYNSYYEDILEPLENIWKSPLDNESLGTFAGEFTSQLVTQWLDNCMEAAYIVSDSKTYRPPRPMTSKGDGKEVTNYFQEIPSEYDFLSENARRASLGEFMYDAHAQGRRSAKRRPQMSISSDPECHWSCDLLDKYCHKVCKVLAKTKETPKEVLFLNNALEKMAGKSVAAPNSGKSVEKRVVRRRGNTVMTFDKLQKSATVRTLETFSSFYSKDKNPQKISKQISQGSSPQPNLQEPQVLLGGSRGKIQKIKPRHIGKKHPSVSGTNLGSHNTAKLRHLTLTEHNLGKVGIFENYRPNEKQEGRKMIVEVESKNNKTEGRSKHSNGEKKNLEYSRKKIAHPRIQKLH